MSMDAKLVKMLLRIVQSDDDRFTANSTLRRFADEYGTSVCALRGKSIYLTPTNKQTIRDLLKGQGADPDISADIWDGLTRAEALAHGNNEKYATEPVKRRRVAVKSLYPTRPIVLDGHPIHLPARCHVEVDYEEIGALPEHDIVILVENWECFNDVHLAANHKDLSFPGEYPLVVWRGDKSGTQSDSMLAMLRKLGKPVAAFVDYDPAGLVIANALPGFFALVSPPFDTLAKMLKANGLHDRYTTQLVGCQATLNGCEQGCISETWEVIRRAGAGLPQEWFVK